MKEVYVPCLDCKATILRDHPARKLCPECRTERRRKANLERAKAFYAANKQGVLSKTKERRQRLKELDVVLPIPGVDAPKRLCPKCDNELVPLRDNGSAKGWRWHCAPCTNSARRERYATDPEYREKVLARCGERHRRLYPSDPAYRERMRKAGQRSKSRLYKDPERHARNLDVQRAWRERGRNRRAAVLRHKYGIDLPDYERMLENQGGCCAICGTDQPGRNQTDAYSFHVDHCHSTGIVRGLLCDRCNRGLGYFSDDAGRLAAAIRYLDESSMGTTARNSA